MATVLDPPVSSEAAAAPAQPATQPAADKLVIVAYSGELEALWASLIMASAGAASGMDTMIFFTFWGLTPLVRDDVRITGDNAMQKMMSLMHRGGMRHMKTSKLNFAGAGPAMMRKLARDHHAASPEELVTLCRELEVRMVPCQMSMDIMGLHADDLIDGLEAPVGAATMLAEAQGAVTFFV
jgi:peroxiredoxin family protein